MTNQLDYSFYEGFELDGFIYGFPDSNGEPHTLTNATDFDGTFIGEPISHPEVYPDTGQDAHITPEGHIIKDTYTGRNFSTRSTGSSSVPELRPTRKRKMDQMLTTERELGCPIFEAEILNEPRTKPTCRGLAAPDMSKVRQHLKRQHLRQQPIHSDAPLRFLQYCQTCNEHFIDGALYSKTHVTVTCRKFRRPKKGEAAQRE
ncbi:hypothetical protein P3342_002368 [Pyrenophora teres f. teres]|nr:hypothetical protein P3342_002368 [Pyrenophora teres f. teres]